MLFITNHRCERFAGVSWFSQFVQFLETKGRKIFCGANTLRIIHICCLWIWYDVLEFHFDQCLTISFCVCLDWKFCLEFATTIRYQWSIYYLLCCISQPSTYRTRSQLSLHFCFSSIPNYPEHKDVMKLGLDENMAGREFLKDLFVKRRMMPHL